MFDKITSRVSKLCYGLDGDFVEPVSSQEAFLRSVDCAVGFAGGDNNEGDIRRVSRRDHGRIGHASCRNRCHDDHQTSGLRHLSCQDCCVQLAQGDQKDFLM